MSDPRIVSRSDSAPVLDPWVPRFSFVIPSAPLRLVLALDVSRQMSIGGRWRRVRDAAFRLISHLPAGAELAIVTFDAGAAVSLKPTVVRSGNREGLHGRVPYRYEAHLPTYSKSNL